MCACLLVHSLPPSPTQQSPVKAGEFGYINHAVTGLAAPPQTLPDPSMPPVVPVGVMGAGEVNPSSFPLSATAVNTGLAPTRLVLGCNLVNLVEFAL